MNDIVINKKVSIERCIAQVREYDASQSDLPFDKDYFKQDAIAMNLQRICELTLDVANHWIKKQRLGVPQDSRDAFQLLLRAGKMPDEMCDGLQAMIGFRNILVHRYQHMDLDVMRRVIEEHLHEPVAFVNLALAELD